jgi:glycosyltransferase involved in cell wall biosynthesis
MNICFLAHGASIHTQRWTHYFRDQGHAVSVISLTDAEPEPGIRLKVLASPGQVKHEGTNWQYLSRLPSLHRAVRAMQPDIVNAHFLSSYGVLGALVQPKVTPLVVSLHGSDILLIPNRSAVHRRAARFALNRADLVTSVAQHMTDVVRDFVADDKPILTLQYGVDTDRFFPPDDHSERMPIVVSNRAMVQTSDLGTILDAANLLKERRSILRVEMLGTGEPAARLQQQATELELEEYVHFAGHVTHEEMADLLRSAAIYVSMSLSDGTSLSLLEAMACGCFPIVSDIPANREWITDGVNGFLVPSRGAAELAERLERAWSDSALRRSAAEYNNAQIRKRGDYRENMAQIEGAFQRLCVKAVTNR